MHTLNRRKQPLMDAPAWIEVGGFLCMFSMLLGTAAAFLIPGMEPAIFVGTIPAWVWLFAYGVHHEGKSL
jgi:hypothetical protein